MKRHIPFKPQRRRVLVGAAAAAASGAASSFPGSRAGERVAGPLKASALGAPVVMRGLHDSRFHEMTSRATGTAYRIYVGGPVSTEASRKYPVVYVLDGKLNFAMVHAQCQILSALGQIPPVIVVGVGYAGDRTFFEKDAVSRLRDLTPNRGGELEAAMLALNGSGAQSEPGGAAGFLAFLRSELKPALEAAYPIDPLDGTILGNSLGGLFPSWVLFHEPDAFRRYVIVSPAWWWNDYQIWEWEARYAQRHDTLDASVFVTAGGLETAAAHREIVERMRNEAGEEARPRFDAYISAARSRGWPRMAEITGAFCERLKLRRYSGLDWAVLNLPDETHESIPGGGFSRGLRFVFGAWRPESSVILRSDYATQPQATPPP